MVVRPEGDSPAFTLMLTVVPPSLSRMIAGQRTPHSVSNSANPASAASAIGAV